MLESLSIISRLLDSPRGILTGDEFLAIDPSCREFLLQQKLLVAAQNATSIVCDACHLDHVELVDRIPTKSGKTLFRIYCPESGSVDVPPNRLAQWTLDRARFVKLANATFPSRTVSKKLEIIEAWKLGELEIGDVTLEVMLACPGAMDALRKSPLCNRTLVITSPPPTHEDQAFAGFITLSDAFEFVDGRLRLRKNSISSKLRVPSTESQQTRPTAKGSGTIPKRSWTQSDLDDEIRKYKAERSPSFSDLSEAVRRGQKNAIEAAGRLFGRNVIAGALGVKSPAMVTNSPVWQSIADELGIPRGKNRNAPKLRKIGLDIAMEAQASHVSPQPFDSAVRGETIRLVHSSLPADQSEPILENLQRGEITDDQARDLIDIVKDQKRDLKTRRTKSQP